MKIAVVGATGLVGREMIRILKEFKIKCSHLILVASPRSTGKEFDFDGEKYILLDHDRAIAMKPDFAIFSAGSSASLAWAEKYASAGTTVVDNSSAWRMYKDIPLIVPEVNGAILTRNNKIIANPNCSTIGLVMVLHPLHLKYKIKRIIVSTYQAVSGSGLKAVQQLENERNGVCKERAYPHPIDLNLFPHAGEFLPDGYTTEEIKLVNETKKILSDDTLQITSTVVRVPVFVGHSESVNIEFHQPYNLETVHDAFRQMAGVLLFDNPSQNIYPMPILAAGRNEVLVGRIRRDESNPNSLNLFLSSDNLRKGAALNAVQIIQYLIENVY